MYTQRQATAERCVSSLKPFVDCSVGIRDGPCKDWAFPVNTEMKYIQPRIFVYLGVKTNLTDIAATAIDHTGGRQREMEPIAGVR